MENVKISALGSVYSPSDDSYLLAKHAPELKGRILDMCTGSGILALTNAKANSVNDVIGVDINPEAVKCAKENAKANRITNVRFIQSDLFEKVEGKFDGIICNPPYLPDSDLNIDAELALSGGKTGREFTDRFLDEVAHYLNEKGRILLIQSSINDLEKTMKRLENKGFRAETIDQDSFFFEKIFVLRVSFS
jgi:release factor glutamine methyltransferase